MKQMPKVMGECCCACCTAAYQHFVAARPPQFLTSSQITSKLSMYFSCKSIKSFFKNRVSFTNKSCILYLFYFSSIIQGCLTWKCIREENGKHKNQINQIFKILQFSKIYLKKNFSHQHYTKSWNFLLLKCNFLNWYWVC